MPDILVYSPYLNTAGGGEVYIHGICEALSRFGTVTLLTLEPVEISTLKSRLGLDFSRFNIKVLSDIIRFPLLRYVQASSLISRLSSAYDLFVNQEHLSLIRPLSRKSILVVEVPYAPGRETWSYRFLSRFKTYYMEPFGLSYDLIICNSQFTASVIRSRYEFHSKKVEVLYPPVHPIIENRPSKENIILTVGRFFVKEHSKKQDILIHAFRQLCREGVENWEFHLAGSVPRSRRDLNYLVKCKRLAQDSSIFFHINCSRRELIDLYKKAKIFWQATGYRESQLTHPERSEHFGIATIEAMSAWVVPVVFNSGGPVEVIQHGRSGFLWKDLESLRSHTRALMLDSKRLSLLAEQARERSLNYHPSKFFQRADQIFSTVF